MELKQLQCFIAVAEELNFTQAAQRMFLSQPSLSRHIHDLEEELDLKLLDRNTKFVQLTPAGAHFLAAAKEVISSSNGLLQTARSLHDGKIGHLNIGYQSSARSIIPFFLRVIGEEAPSITLTLENKDADDLFQSLLDGTFDIIFAFTYALDVTRYADINRERLSSKFLLEDRMVIFMSKEKYNQYGPDAKLSFADLEDETFLQIDRTINPGYFEVLHQLYLKHHFYPKKLMEVRTLETLLLFVEAGFGISLLPLHSTVTYNPGISYHSFREYENRMPIHAFWCSSNRNTCLSLLLKKL